MAYKNKPWFKNIVKMIFAKNKLLNKLLGNFKP